MVFSIQDLLFQLESVGVYDYLLPFLLIFAIVFGILTYLRIFGDNKGIHLIIAMVIGLLGVRSNFLTQFYSEVFPRLGIGVTIILVIFILLGMFIAEEHKTYWMWGIGGIALIIAIVVIIKTFSYLGWDYGSYWGEGSITWIVFAVLLLALIIAVATSTGGGDSKPSSNAAAGAGKFLGVFEPKRK